MENRKIAVLLSTYNGEKYIEELLESILNQSYTNFHIFVRDDGSSDNTYNKIVTIHDVNKEKITVIDSSYNIGVKSSFSNLISYVLDYFEFEYFMFADQDDVWLKNKISKSYTMMNQLNQQKPIIVHTDMYVTDSKLNVISKSFWEYQHINPEKSSFNRLLVQNVVTGCTIIFNRKLASMAVPIPEKAIMHDWWLGIIASAFGDIHYDKEPTIYYRQHESNTLGAHNYSYKSMFSKIFTINLFDHNLIQAQIFRNVFYNELSDIQKVIINSFCKLKKLSFFERLRIICKFGFYKNGVFRNLAMILFFLKSDDKINSTKME